MSCLWAWCWGSGSSLRWQLRGFKPESHIRFPFSGIILAASEKTAPTRLHTRWPFLVVVVLFCQHRSHWQFRAFEPVFACVSKILILTAGMFHSCCSDSVLKGFFPGFTVWSCRCICLCFNSLAHLSNVSSLKKWPAWDAMRLSTLSPLRPQPVGTYREGIQWMCGINVMG